MGNISEDIIEALLTPPWETPGEVDFDKLWCSNPYKAGSLTGKQQEAAIYLGHVKVAKVHMPNIRLKGFAGYWMITNALHRAINHDPELIVMSARMQKWMME